MRKGGKDTDLVTRLGGGVEHEALAQAHLSVGRRGVARDDHLGELLLAHTALHVLVQHAHADDARGAHEPMVAVAEGKERDGLAADEAVERVLGRVLNLGGSARGHERGRLGRQSTRRRRSSTRLAAPTSSPSALALAAALGVVGAARGLV